MIERHRILLSDLGLLSLRLGFGGLMLMRHGLPKLAGFAEKMDGFADPLGVSSPVSLALAVGAEFFASLLVMMGLATRAAAVPLVFTMAVAAFLVHGDDPFSKKEFALVYGLGFLTLVLTGAGRFSVDARLRR